MGRIIGIIGGIIEGIIGTDPILFGPGFAVLLTGLHGLQYFSNVCLLWPYGGMCSLRKN